jgi:hypothetical protein
MFPNACSRHSDLLSAQSASRVLSGANGLATGLPDALPAPTNADTLRISLSESLPWKLGMRPPPRCSWRRTARGLGPTVSRFGPVVPVDAAAEKV